MNQQTLLGDSELYFIGVNPISFYSGVMMAARSLITLYRQKNPKMLHKSNRVGSIHSFIQAISIGAIHL